MFIGLHSVAPQPSDSCAILVRSCRRRSSIVICGLVKPSETFLLVRPLFIFDIGIVSFDIASALEVGYPGEQQRDQWQHNQQEPTYPLMFGRL